MVTLKNILVATDFSEPSSVALAYGRDLARSYGARLHVLHAVEDVMLRYASEIAFAAPNLQDELEASATREVHALITDDDRQSIDLCEIVERSVNPASTIVDYARSHLIDLIVTGTHGRTAVKHFLMGSVAERVVRTAPCPVLTVRAHEREFIAPDAIAPAAARV